jgi:hypothetical protein
MSREVYVRIWEGVGVRFTRATRLSLQGSLPSSGTLLKDGDGYKPLRD